MQATRKTSKRSIRVIAAALLLSAGLTSALSLAASAQFAEPLGAFGGPMPPPPGDGPTPLPVEPGDMGAPLPPASGEADRTHGNVFPAGVGRDRTVVRVYKRSSGGALGADRGNRMVTTIRPDQLSQEAIGKINGILGINMQSGEQSIDITADDSQIEQVQDVLAAYPQYGMEGGRKKINNDAPGAGYPKPGRGSLTSFVAAPPGSPASREYNVLPTVKTFSRYLVILGVVSATIWMALAATSVVMGSRDGGARVVGSAAGLMLLLMAYTIWKVVQLNTTNNNSTTVQNQSRPTDAQVSDAFIQESTVPGVPNVPPGGPPRSGVPLEPLGGPR